jgi:acetyl esterase/lipase
MTTPERHALRLPAREIPAPSSISRQAQGTLTFSMPVAEFPPLGDAAAWRRLVDERDAAVLAMVGDRVDAIGAESRSIDVDGVPVYEVVPHGLPGGDRRVFLEVHGGAFIYGGGEFCRIMGLRALGRSRARTWAVDYRMPPDHRYPAALDDCVTAYRALLRDHPPHDVIISGISSGGNLAAATILRARDEGLPLPAAALLMTPQADLTESGDSFSTNLGLDNVLTASLMPVNRLYAGDHDLTDPYLSPLFADFTKGFPPTLLSTGTRDLFLSNTVRLHRALRAAGVPAELHVMEAAGHAGFFSQAPEDEALEVEIRRFVDAHWAPG